MNKTCITYRDELPGYRLGEGAPLERERLRTHLEGCSDCRAHLEAYETLVRDAREEPPALLLEDKDRIWRTIERELPGSHPSLIDSLSKLFTPKWQPALGLGVACLAYVVLVNPVSEQQPNRASAPIVADLNQAAESTLEAKRTLEVVLAELSQPTTHLALEVAPGIEARTTAKAQIRKTGTARAPRLELTNGDLLAEFTRQPKQEPMVVQTPHFEAIVRGTIFVIRVDDTGSSLTVADGKVEARRSGMSVMVTAGQSLRITDDKDSAADPTKLDAPNVEDANVINAMKELFPNHQSEATAAPVKAQAKAIQKPAPRPSIEDPTRTLQKAREAWLNGKLNQAKTQVTALLQHPSLSPKLQDDARLLRASILRARNEINEAMVDLEVVASMGREGSRVAAFELGRLAKEQGRLVTAKRALKQVLTTNESDVLGEEARFELCQLLTEEGSGDESVECWQALQDATDPSLRDKANQALNER